jgi:prenyl protein peptidase
MFAKINFENLNLFESIAACFLMGSFYVLSLYLWGKQNRYNRNHPSVIKRRFLSVTVSSLFSVCLLYWLGQTAASQKQHEAAHYHSLNNWVGVRFDAKNFFFSVFGSLALTIILFMGPVLQNFYNFYQFEMDEFEAEAGNANNKYAQCWLNVLKSGRKAMISLDTWRNFIVGPFTEEFVFRSCMLPLLASKLSMAQAVFITPLFFGLAHLHHIVEGYKMNHSPLKHLVLLHTFQFSYTYIFGAYSSFLFLRTGQLFASFLCHSFCNLMGFPRINEVVSEIGNIYYKLIAFAYVLGLLLFIYLLFPLTSPDWFDNRIYYLVAT